MRRALLSTTALALCLLVAGAGAAAASTETPSPSPSPSVSAAPAADLDESESPSPSPSIPSTAPSAPAEDDTAALEPTLGLAPTFTCDDDPSDDFQIPEDGDGVTYTLEDGVFTAALDEGYEWGPGGWDPWRDPGYSDPYISGDPGTTDPIIRPLADMAFPKCDHDDETQVTLTAECTDGMGYLVYDIDAPWATDEIAVELYPFTADEAAGGHSVYDGTGLSGRLAWDGSTPGMTDPIGVWWGTDLYDPLDEMVYDPIFLLSLADPSGSGTHRALAKVDFQSADPCAGVDPGTPGDDGGDGGDSSTGGDDDELAATGPEAAWLTAGAAALLVAVGATLVVVRRRMNA